MVIMTLNGPFKTLFSLNLIKLSLKHLKTPKKP